MLRESAKKLGASFHFFECSVPRALALERIAARRKAGTDISEARPEHYDHLKKGFEPVEGWPSAAWTRISDNRPAERTQEAALRTLRLAWTRL
jgi:predicted kinase